MPSLLADAILRDSRLGFNESVQEILASATSVTLSSAEAKDNVGKRVKSACNKNFSISQIRVNRLRLLSITR